jgi:hypothetical protein
MNAAQNVTHQQALTCLQFLADNGDFAAPLTVLDAYIDFEATADAPANVKREAIDRFAAALTRWLRTDRAACVGLLGPGLGLEG